MWHTTDDGKCIWTLLEDRQRLREGEKGLERSAKTNRKKGGIVNI